MRKNDFEYTMSFVLSSVRHSLHLFILRKSLELKEK